MFYCWEPYAEICFPALTVVLGYNHKLIERRAEIYKKKKMAEIHKVAYIIHLPLCCQNFLPKTLDLNKMAKI